MEIRMMNLSELKPSDYNPRKALTSDDSEYNKIANSIKEFGYIEPIIWNQQTGNIVGGHQRLTILKDQGQEKAEVVVVNLSLHDEKILNVLLNRAKGRWDNEKLAELMKQLDEADAVELTGFDEWELQGLLDDYNNQLGNILNYHQPEADGDDSGSNDVPEEPQTFDMTFSIPIEEQPAVNAYLEAFPNAEFELAAAIINLVKGVLGDED